MKQTVTVPPRVGRSAPTWCTTLVCAVKGGTTGSNGAPAAPSAARPRRFDFLRGLRGLRYSSMSHRVTSGFLSMICVYLCVFAVGPGIRNGAGKGKDRRLDARRLRLALPTSGESARNDSGHDPIVADHWPVREFVGFRAHADDSRPWPPDNGTNLRWRPDSGIGGVIPCAPRTERTSGAVGYCAKPASSAPVQRSVAIGSFPEAFGTDSREVGPISR